MKEIFQMIVESFQGLYNIDNSSFFGKTIKILDIVAEFRACVIMIDLGCEDLIFDMFHQFLIVIETNYKQNVLSFMQSIMSLIIEESDDYKTS